MKITNEVNKKKFYDAVDQRGRSRPGRRDSWLTAERDADGNIEKVLIHSFDSDDHFADLMSEEQEKALAWIRENIFPRQSPLYHHTSYGMKHDLEYRTNIYMTNNQFKEAMLLCGYYPVDVHAINWEYCISKCSPIFKRLEDGRFGLRIPELEMDYTGVENEGVSL